MPVSAGHNPGRTVFANTDEDMASTTRVTAYRRTPATPNKQLYLEVQS